MRKLTSAQKAIAAVAIGIVASIIGTIIFALVTDSNGSASMVLTFTFLYFGLPTFLILGVLSFAYFKEESKKDSSIKEKFVSKSMSPVRVVMVVSGIVAAFVIIYIVWAIVSIFLNPVPNEVPTRYDQEPASQTIN